MFMLRIISAAVLAGLASVGAITGLDYLQQSSGAWATWNEPNVLHEESDVTVYAGAAPSWTVRRDAPDRETATAQRLEGARMLLWDVQADLVGDEPTIYYDAVVDPLTSTGVRIASLFTIGFRPDTQKLVLHDVSVMREGSWESRIDNLSINISRPSNPGSSLIFTGDVSVLVRIANVQPEDLVRVAYSISGEPDIIDHGNSQYVGPPVFPIERLRASVRLPRDEGSYESFGDFAEPQELESRRDREIVFYDAPYQVPTVDPLIPIWHFPASFAMATTTPDWQAVSDWTDNLYQPVESDAVDAIAAEIRENHRNREDQIMAALRYVQREIRYFAVVLGNSGFQPAHPDDTLARSEGECKAKTMLLISILDALGIEADAALVNGFFGPGIDQLPPSVMAFNHVITTLEHDGQRYWLDPTASEQGGTLASVYQPEYGWALIGGGSGDLVWIDVPIAEPLVTINERYVLSGDRAGDMANAVIEWTYYGPWADQARTMSDSMGEDQLSIGFAQFYADRFVTFANNGIEYVDEPLLNRFTIRMNWDVIPRALNVNPNDPSVIAFAAHAAYPLVVPLQKARNEPVVLGYPFHVLHRIDVEFPDGENRWPVIAPTQAARENEAFSHSYEIIPRNGGVQLVAELEVRDRELEGSDQALALQHAAEVNQGVVLLIGPENVMVDTRYLPQVLAPSLTAFPQVIQERAS